MEVYEPLGVVMLGIEKGERRSSFSGNIRDPLDFVNKMGWTFRNGVDRDGSVYRDYAAIMDTYYVIDAAGTVTYISPVTGFEQGAINVPALEAAIVEALQTVPARPVSWSAIKMRWR